MQLETESIDKLFLELSQITKAKTAREIELENQIGDLRIQIQRMSLNPVRQIIEALESVERDATMERSSFDLMWPDKEDPLPTSEDEVTAFIRRRTDPWRRTWVLGPIGEALKILRASTVR